MPRISAVEFENGKVQFNPKRDAIGPTSEIDGEIAIHNYGLPARPAHYQVSFVITFECEERGVRYRDMSHWTCMLLTDDDTLSYREVESRAARQLAPMLRAVADQVEEQVAAFDAQ